MSNKITSQAYTNFIHNLVMHNHWAHQNPIQTMSFLFEETGELSRAIRSIELGRSHPGEAPLTDTEKQANLKEELGDCLSQLITIAEKYGLTLDEVMNDSYDKLSERWHYDNTKKEG